MIVVSLVIVICVMALLIFTTVRNKKSADKLRAYALSKSWQIGTDAPLTPTMERQGYHSDKSIMEGTLNNQRFWLYVCQPPVVQTGKQRGDTAITMLSVELPLSFSDLLLVPSAGALNVAQDEVAKRFFGLQPLTLEGDFNQHFRLYTQNGTQIETLEIFTPDVMASLETNLTNAVLLSGQYLSIWMNIPVNDVTTVESMVRDAELVTGEIQSKAQYKLASAPNG